MRAALVQCPPWGSLPPLGLASLKAYIEPHGHEARCFDLNIDYCRERHQDILDSASGSVYARPDPWSSGSFDDWTFEFDGEVQFKSALAERPLPVERWADQVLEFAPHVAGFSLQSTNLGVTLQVAQAIVRRDPSILVVFGGPNVAEAQEGAMALATGIPDLVVEGEGEETLLEVLEVFGKEGDLSSIPGIGRLVDGAPSWTTRRPLLRSVDNLPFPDFTDFDWSTYPNPYEIPVMTSRGCVLNCAFCYETVYWKRFRTQSPERVVDEIQYQIANHPLRADVERGGTRFGISFADSLVNGHLGGLKRMAEMLIERDTDIYWNGQATVNTKMDDDFFRKLSKSGCSGLSFGLESGSQHVLESMGKRFQVSEATDFFRRVAHADIELFVNVMVGFPTETRADFVETLRFLRRIRRLINMVNNVGPTGVVGGSRIHQSPEEFGVVPVDLAQWDTGESFQWTSRSAGTEQNRLRRLKILHLWMKVMRVPHQRIGPSTSRRLRRPRSRKRTRLPASNSWTSPPLPAVAIPVAAPVVKETRVELSTRRTTGRIRQLTRTIGTEPLLLSATDGKIDQALSTPEWAEALQSARWVGLLFEEVRSLVASELGNGLRESPNQNPDGTLEVDIEVVEPHLGNLAGLRIHLFPPARGQSTQMLAIFPASEREQAHHRGGSSPQSASN